MRLLYLTANAAYAFAFGDQLLRIIGRPQRQRDDRDHRRRHLPAARGLHANAETDRRAPR